MCGAGGGDSAIDNMTREDQALGQTLGRTGERLPEMRSSLFMRKNKIKRFWKQGERRLEGKERSASRHRPEKGGKERLTNGADGA